MVRIAKNNDLDIIVDMSLNIFKNSQKDELYDEFKELLSNDDVCLFVKEKNGLVVAFAQVQLRKDYVEGCETSPVGYLEGIFVDEKFRGNGYAKELLGACENWAKCKGCTEFASDCEIDNIDSFKFHLSVGFNEQNRIICFKKNI